MLRWLEMRVNRRHRASKSIELVEGGEGEKRGGLAHAQRFSRCTRWQWVKKNTRAISEPSELHDDHFGAPEVPAEFAAAQLGGATPIVRRSEKGNEGEREMASTRSPFVRFFIIVNERPHDDH